MMRLAICCILVLLGFPGTVHASLNSAKQTVTKIEKIGINENTSTEIKQLYDELTDAIKKHETEYAQYQNKLAENARKMKEKEQSTTNKLIGAIGIGAGGIGGQQLMSKMAEQSADEDAERDMRAYMATMHCDYGGGTTVKIGETEISLPGGNDLMPLRTEYVSLAAELKEMKTALEMAPGLESQEIFDSAATQLFDDQPVEQTAGAYASLARAISDQDSEDAAVYKKQTADTKSQLKTAAAIAAVGIVGAAAANISANKDAPKEESAKIKTEHEAEQAKIESKINDTEQRLARAVDANKQKIAEFNKLLAAHKQFLQSATDSECVKKISQEYIEYINSLKPIENDLQTIPELKYDFWQRSRPRISNAWTKNAAATNATPTRPRNGTVRHALTRLKTRLRRARKTATRTTQMTTALPGPGHLRPKQTRTTQPTRMAHNKHHRPTTWSNRIAVRRSTRA